MGDNESVCRCDRCGSSFTAGQHDQKSLCASCVSKLSDICREHEDEMRRIEERRQGN